MAFVAMALHLRSKAPSVIRHRTTWRAAAGGGDCASKGAVPPYMATSPITATHPHTVIFAPHAGGIFRHTAIFAPHAGGIFRQNVVGTAAAEFKRYFFAELKEEEQGKAEKKVEDEELEEGKGEEKVKAVGGDPKGEEQKDGGGRQWLEKLHGWVMRILKNLYGLVMRIWKIYFVMIPPIEHVNRIGTLTMYVIAIYGALTYVKSDQEYKELVLGMKILQTLATKVCAYIKDEENQGHGISLVEIEAMPVKIDAIIGHTEQIMSRLEQESSKKDKNGDGEAAPKAEEEEEEEGN